MRLYQFIKLYQVARHTPRLLTNWPQFYYQYVRHYLRLALPIRVGSGENEIRMRNGLVFRVYAAGGLYPVFAEVMLCSRYDGDPRFHVRPEDTVLDIGANVGFFTAKAARSATSGRVYAFEPCSPHFRMLQDNVARNDLGNVSAFREAVWGRNGETALNYSLEPEPTNTSIYDIGGDRSETVATVTLEHVLQREEINRCHFLKLDCEGAEYDILQNATRDVLSIIDRIALEWHRFDPCHDPQKLANFLRTQGYEIRGSRDWTRVTGYLQAFRA